MCGRYILDIKPEKLYQKYNIKNTGKLSIGPMLNIFPSLLLPVITKKHNENVVEIMKWGMNLDFGKSSYALINTRAESLIGKTSFLQIYLNQRCLIPATGFFEWKKEKEYKIPYKFWIKNTEIFSFAGIYNMTTDSNNKIIKTFSIVTTKPNSLVEQIHNRMPVILNENDENIWLNKDSTFAQLDQTLKPFSSKEMENVIVKI